MRTPKPLPLWAGGGGLTGTCASGDCALADCTSAFVVYYQVSGVRLNSLLTAGHCFIAYSPVTTRTGTPIGRVNQRFWSDGVSADVEEIDIAYGTKSAQIFTFDSTKKPVTSLRTTQSTNDGVCKSGITTSQTCSWDVAGIHMNIEVTDPGTGEKTLLVDQLRAIRSTKGVDEGDSGGPVYEHDGSGVRAHGIVSAQSDGGKTMYYSFLKNALTLTGTNLCTASIC